MRSRNIYCMESSLRRVVSFLQKWNYLIRDTCSDENKDLASLLLMHALEDMELTKDSVEPLVLSFIDIELKPCIGADHSTAMGKNTWDYCPTSSA